MAASANPAANGGEEGRSDANGATTNGVSVPDNSVYIGPTQAALRHDSGGLSIEWTPDEQLLLEELLAKYATHSILVRYGKIAMQLKDKCLRDVALRCKSMNKKENGKRRKEDPILRKNKDTKEKVTNSMPNSTNAANRTDDAPYAQTSLQLDTNDGISFQAIGGPTGQLLQENAQALDQISANFSIFKIQENINLFCQARNNIVAILNGLTNAPEVMKQMPPLPVKLNDELANSILQRPPLSNTSGGPGSLLPRVP